MNELFAQKVEEAYRGMDHGYHGSVGLKPIWRELGTSKASPG